MGLSQGLGMDALRRWEEGTQRGSPGEHRQRVETESWGGAVAAGRRMQPTQVILGEGVSEAAACTAVEDPVNVAAMLSLAERQGDHRSHLHLRRSRGIQRLARQQQATHQYQLFTWHNAWSSPSWKDGDPGRTESWAVIFADGSFLWALEELQWRALGKKEGTELMRRIRLFKSLDPA